MPIDHEVEDIEILNEEPTNFWIGKGLKRKKLVIQLLCIDAYYEKFIPLFVDLLGRLSEENNKLVLPTGKMWKSAKQLDQIRQYLSVVFSHRKNRKALINLIHKVGYMENFKKKFFEKNVDPLQLIEIFLYIYKHNIDGFKKKLLEAIELVLGSNPLSLTSIAKLSKKAGRKEKLKPRFRRLKK